MAVELAPSEEAMQAIVDRINSAETYCVSVAATYSEQIVDVLEDLPELRVDVASEDEEQLNETLELEDRTSHSIRIYVREKLNPVSEDRVAALKLVTRQIFQRVNNWDSDDRRVCVWECDMDPKEVPDKNALNNLGLFVASILLRVEVEPS